MKRLILVITACLTMLVSVGGLSAQTSSPPQTGTAPQTGTPPQTATPPQTDSSAQTTTPDQASSTTQTDDGKFILDTESPADRKARMAWWKDARFGMFVHWGLYSSTDGEWGDKKFVKGAEWIQRNAGISADVYEKTMRPKFKPKEGFATEWAKLAKRAGAKYVVYTNKHHEGFAMHDSAQTEYDAKDFTGRDLHKEIVEAIRAEGLHVGLYHSLWDWHHPDAPAGKGAMNLGGLSMDDRELPRYIDYLHAQVE